MRTEQYIAYVILWTEERRTGGFAMQCGQVPPTPHHHLTITLSL